MTDYANNRFAQANRAHKVNTIVTALDLELESYTEQEKLDCLVAFDRSTWNKLGRRLGFKSGIGEESQRQIIDTYRRRVEQAQDPEAACA